MELCFSSQVVILLSIIGISLDIYLAGFSAFSLFIDLLVTFLLVLIVNWACFREGFNWVAWLIVIFNIFAIINLFIFVLFAKTMTNNEEAKQIIAEERKKRGT